MEKKELEGSHTAFDEKFTIRKVAAEGAEKCLGSRTGVGSLGLVRDDAGNSQCVVA
jgi:hypothetical protein